MAQNLVGQVAELQPHRFAGLLALLALRFAPLGLVRLERRDFGRRRSTHRRQLGLGPGPPFALFAHLRLGGRAGFVGRPLLVAQPLRFASLEKQRRSECRGQRSEHDDCNDDSGVHTSKGRKILGK